MKSSNLTEYFEKQLELLSIESQSLSELSVNSIKTKLIERIFSLESNQKPHILIPETKGNLFDLTEKINNPPLSFGAKLRKKQLKQNHSRKKELILEGENIDTTVDNFPNTSKSQNITISDNDRLKILKHYELERKRREENRKNSLEALQRKYLEKLELESKEMEERQKRQEEEKKLKIQEKLEEIEIRKKEREEKIIESNKAFKHVASVKPLFQKLEERYQQQYIIPELEKRKYELAQKRQMLAPINMKEIISHEKNYFENFEELRHRRELELKRKKQDIALHEASLVFYKSKAAQVLEKEELEKMQEQMKKDIERTDNIEKRKIYGDIISEMFRPICFKPSKAETTSSQNKKPKKLEIQKSLDSKQFEPLEFNKNGSNTERNKKNTDILRRKNSIRSQTNKKLRKPPNESVNSSVQSLGMKKEQKSIDYLRELRQKRNENLSMIIGKIKWEDIVEDKECSTPEKVSEVQKRALRAEQQARSYESFVNDKNISNAKRIEANEALSQVYIDAIKAKLAVLNSIS
ncbi:unnamed protein product [Blepharisma stoltei]|uniref:Uncharacterized protein n=1 Tax=Blepharisma stoltei TaxID=1481888 RepID=A0AAU9IU92_9CILI|nr:unnamed protein product [Blepharisma stoltei]